MTKTTNYQLNQWDATDRVLRTDFNEDNRKIDAALGEMPKIAVGSYTGTGEYGADHPNTLEFPFSPRLLAVFPRTGGSSLLYPRGVLKGNTASNGHSSGDIALSWEGSTVSWYSTDSGGDASCQLNHSGIQLFRAGRSMYRLRKMRGIMA